MSRLLTTLSAHGAALHASRRGSIPILFALSLVPLIGLVGLGIDYGVAASDKSKLDTAADAAALAGIVTTKAFIADNAGQADLNAKAVAAGITKATNVFRANLGNVALAQIDFPTPQITRSGQTLTAVVKYSATVSNTFGRLFGTTATTLTNSSTASADIASYLDFYLLLDVSGSMGLPASDAGMTQLASVNKDMFSDYQQGCQFACHFPNNTGWGLAAGKIQLRSDAVNNAVCSLIQRASTPVVANQYRVGLYPFVNQMGVLTSITTNMSMLLTTAQCDTQWPLALTNLLDTGSTQLATNNDPSTGTGSGGTHFDTVLPQMKSAIATFGDGSLATQPKSFVFLVTDGMQNDQNFSSSKNGKRVYPGSPTKFPGYDDANWDGSKPRQIDSANCDALKKAGATISILYIPYNIITFKELNSKTIITENKKVNTISPGLSTPLKACASSGFFFTANSADDIKAALNSMFDKALQVARLTQ